MENETQITESSPNQEVALVPGTTSCLGGTTPIALKNYASRNLTVTVQITSSTTGFPSKVETEQHSLYAGELKDLGCQGCGTFSGIQRCKQYVIIQVS